MIRILHVIDHLGLGGAQSALLDIVRSTSRAEYAVEVAVMHGRGQFADALEAEGFHVHVLSKTKNPPAYLWNFPRLLRAGNYDILHFHLNGANWIAKTLAAAMGSQTARIAHDHTSGNLKFRGWQTLGPDAATHHFSDAVIAVAQDVKDFLMRYEALAPDKVVVVPNGIDTDSFQPFTDEERRAAREKLGLPADAFIAGSLGRLAFEKNFALLVELAAAVPDLHIYLGGAGPLESDLRARIASAGVGSRVIMPGQVTDRVGFYRALDVFILPSLFEGRPLTILEAMSSGLPVLASRRGGSPGAISEGKNGLLADPEDVHTFAAQLARLRESPAFSKKLAAAARNTVLDLYSATGTARQVEGVYKAVIAARSESR